MELVSASSWRSAVGIVSGEPMPCFMARQPLCQHNGSTAFSARSLAQEAMRVPQSKRHRGAPAQHACCMREA